MKYNNYNLKRNNILNLRTNHKAGFEYKINNYYDYHC